MTRLTEVLFAGALAVALVACGDSGGDLDGPDGESADSGPQSDGHDVDGSGASGGDGPGELCGAVSCGARERCEQGGGAPHCVCDVGFSGQRCADEAECASSDACGAHASCVEGFGAHACSCELGYVLEGDECQDIDECAVTGVCAAGASCTNEGGTFSCTCPPGEVGNGFFCKAEADCNPESCSAHGVCLETQSGSACACEVGYSGPSCASPCSSVDFVDASLEALVRALVQKPAGALLPSDLAAETHLFAAREGISSLAGLECWPALEFVDLSGNDLEAEALEVFSNLGALDTLLLDCNPVDDLGALAEHPSLRVLSLAQNGLDCPALTPSLTPLSSLSRLTWLDVTGQSLSSVAALSGSKRLRVLGLSGNELNDADLGSLGSLPLLEALELGNNQLSGLAWATQFPALVRLGLNGNQLEQVEALAELTRLENLEVVGNNLKSLAGLEGHQALRYLDVSQNQLADLSPLASLTGILELHLVANDVETVVDLDQPARRGRLYLESNPVICEPELWEREQERLARLVEQGVDISPWPQPTLCAVP